MRKRNGMKQTMRKQIQGKPIMREEKKNEAKKKKQPVVPTHAGEVANT